MLLPIRVRHDYDRCGITRLFVQRVEVGSLGALLGIDTMRVLNAVDLIFLVLVSRGCDTSGDTRATSIRSCSLSVP